MFDDIQISTDVISAISVKMAFEKRVVPLKIEDNYLFVAMTDKNNLTLLNDLEFYTGNKIKPIEWPSNKILQTIKDIYGEIEVNDENNKVNENKVSEYSNVEFVNQIISDAIRASASDIHFEIYENKARIRFRIDGYLQEVLEISKSKSIPVSSRLKIMANLDISEKRRPQDGRIKFENNSNSIDIRVSTLPTSFGEKIVLRILDKSKVQLDIKKLGVSNKQLEIISKNINLPYGMILVTGPTGSGKTTSLYASLQAIHSPEKNIMTIEDPIEYNIEGINQINVKHDIGFDFASALRSFLRQDPDVIMVGEIRDRETAEIAIRASLTGHLVFSTLHTNDSISAITRLIDMGIEPFLVAASIKMIVAQRLVRRLCECKEKTTNPIGGKSINITEAYNKVGCSNCNGSGYKGRLAIFEILEIKEELAAMIVENSSAADIKAEANRLGFDTLRTSGVDKIREGTTTIDEVLRETML